MKEFDLKKALKGSKVITRSGVNVEELFVFKGNIDYPIVALLEEADCIVEYTEQGEFIGGSWSNNDLFMAGVKKEGWINLYKKQDDAIKFSHPEFVENYRYKTKQDAIDHIYIDNIIDTIKIEWEE